MDPMNHFSFVIKPWLTESGKPLLMGDRSGAQEVPYDLKCGSHDQGHEGLPYGGGEWTEHAVGMQEELEQVFGLRPLYDYSHNLFLLCDAL